jgi:hypothetical protein
MQTNRIFPLDVEHAGIRLTIPILAIGGFFSVYLGVMAASSSVNQDYIGCAAFASGIVASILIAVLADRILKRVWPSSKRLVMDNSTLTYHDGRQSAGAVTLTLNNRVNALTWRFTIKRSSAKAPRGWQMIGLQLLQDETRLSLFTFMSSTSAEQMPLYSLFTALIPRTALDKSDLPLREATIQRRLLAAEDDRWAAGLEVRREDFGELLKLLEPHISDWNGRA